MTNEVNLTDTFTDSCQRTFFCFLYSFSDRAGTLLQSDAD